MRELERYIAAQWGGQRWYRIRTDPAPARKVIYQEA